MGWIYYDEVLLLCQPSKIIIGSVPVITAGCLMQGDFLPWKQNILRHHNNHRNQRSIAAACGTGIQNHNIPASFSLVLNFTQYLRYCWHIPNSN